MLSEVARNEGITVIGGSIPERSDGQFYNTCFVFAPNGILLAKHRKVHLFDFDAYFPGDVAVYESNSFSAGAEATVVDTDVGRIGIGICHDIRFPELAMIYRARGARLICYPGAFNMSTGEALWELEQRARAVDNQVFVATCSPSRDSEGSYTIWGHSSVINPLGEVVATTGHDEAVVIAEVDYSALQLTSADLAQNRYFEDEAFIGYLKYLQYWQRPEYLKFIMYPHCLFFLELLQNASFRNAMAHPANKELAHRQQFYLWKNYRNNRLKHILPKPLPEASANITPTPPALPPTTTMAAAAAASSIPPPPPPQAPSPMQYGSSFAKKRPKKQWGREKEEEVASLILNIL